MGVLRLWSLIAKPQCTVIGLCFLIGGICGVTHFEMWLLYCINDFVAVGISDGGRRCDASV